MHLKDIDLNLLRLFDAICLTRNVSRAAELLDITQPNDIVIDPFLGSGSTLIAAERAGRRCRAIEIEPAYVDVAIRRWQAATGKTAMLEETGAPFDEVAQQRAQDSALALEASDAHA